MSTKYVGNILRVKRKRVRQIMRKQENREICEFKFCKNKLWTFGVRK